MAFSYKIQDRKTPFGLKVVTGTYDCSVGAVTGGDIYTGLSMVLALILQPTGAAVTTNQSSVNETMPHADGITIVTAASQTGTWIAVGY